MKPNKFLLITALVLGSSVLAIAAPTTSKQPPLPPEVLAKYDTDGDGKLSDAEKAAMKADLEAKRKELIAKFDTDGDGVLNATERAAAEAYVQAQRLAEQTAKFAELDKDSSGGLSAEEFAAGAPKGATADKIAAAFKRIDKNADKSISLEEFTAKPERPIPEEAKKKFAELDADVSGGLTLAEFTKGAPKGATAAQIQAAFTKLDKDASGVLSLEEFAAGKPPPPNGGTGGNGSGGPPARS